MKNEKSEVTNQRILGRILARELSAEEMELVGGQSIDGLGAIDPTDSPILPISTAVWTIPAGKEDQ